MSKVEIKLVFGCINCDKPIPMKVARLGVQLCSEKCRQEINRKAPNRFAFDESEVWK